MRRFTHYTALLLFGLLCTMASCQKEYEFRMQQDTDGRLTARKSALVTRSVLPNSNFEINTRYRLWAYKDGSYMFNVDGETNGILAKESSGKYIEMEQKYAKLLHESFNIYGFTDGQPHDDADVTDALLQADGDCDNPRYTIAYDGNINEGYTDYLRACLKYDRESGLTSSVMEFKHILSRIRVQVIQQGVPGEDGKLTGFYDDLKLHSAEITGVYDKYDYDVSGDKFSLSQGEEKRSRVLKNVANGEDIIPAEAVTAPFSESFILPTLECEQDEPLTLKLVISGSDAKHFSKTANPENTDQYIVSVPLNDRINKDEEGKYTLPLVFRSNCSYMLRVVFAEDGVVLFTPLVYPWFDGETDKWENGEGYEEQNLGNTYLFGNLIWSDRNLGADDYLPENEKRFLKCTGFYYQFGRNIPYFPMNNNNGVLTNNLVNGTNVYPMISHPQGRLHAPSDNNINAYIMKLEDLESSIASGKLAGYRTPNGGFDTGLWDKVATQPAPPGWRLPTQEEFLGIMPSTPHTGNITFMKNLKHNGASSIGAKEGGDFYDDDDVKVIYIHVPNKDEYPNYPEDGKYENSYGPSNSNVVRRNYDPSPGYESEYIISRAFDDETGELETPPSGWKKSIWGTIYGIKKVGTKEAYRMRWRIENVAKGKNYYCLVVERFPATATDRLSRHESDAYYYRKYDWSRPVAVLYLPISGMIGDDAWQPGKLGNFGTETIFATSDKSTGNAYKTFRIKIAGDNRYNQFIYPAEDRNSNGAQIRLVRESTYQPDRQ